MLMNCIQATLKTKKKIVQKFLEKKIKNNENHKIHMEVQIPASEHLQQRFETPSLPILFFEPVERLNDQRMTTLD